MSSVEARLDTLEKEIQRLKDVHEIEKTFARHCINHTSKNMSKTISFFALDEPTVSVEVGDRGVYVGRKAIETLFQDQYGAAAWKGNLLFPFLTTPMIEISGDGKHAKSAWRSPSVQALMPKDGNGDADPIWLFGSYAVDWVKKGSEWKILHFHWYRMIKASHYQGWVKDQTWANGGPLPNSPDLLETTYHNPYSMESIQDSIPGCPKPFEKYDGPEWMNKEQADVWGL
ncbi:hypothetical protein MNV49_001216 [Pseudohyphozyma bogoriensis]|nr:hypothetical protein MNV49_001216 [Pseudohyphozyma bogoriensis]